VEVLPSFISGTELPISMIVLANSPILIFYAFYPIFKLVVHAPISIVKDCSPILIKLQEEAPTFSTGPIVIASLA